MSDDDNTECSEVSGDSERVDKQPTSNRKKKDNAPFEKGNTFGFQKGQSGNPGGRVKGINIRGMFEDYLHTEKDGRTRLDELVEGVFEHAMKGNSPYMNQLFDRTFGKVRDEDGAIHPTTVVFNTIPKVNDEE